MSEKPAHRASSGRQGVIADIVLDVEFRDLHLAPSPEELQAIVAALYREGCREALVVWPFPKGSILLTGYEIFPHLRKDRIPFRIVEKQFPTRDAARMFIVRHQLSKQHLSPLAVSYLRGLRYASEKLPHGGRRERRNTAGSPFSQLKTAEALADEFGVSPATVRMDGAFAGAVNDLVAHCGAEIKSLLLARSSPWTRGRIMAVANMEPARQREVMCQWQLTGRLPRISPLTAKPTITLPLDPDAMATTLQRRLGPEKAEAIAQAILKTQGAFGKPTETGLDP